MKLTLSPDSLSEPPPDFDFFQETGRRSAAPLWVTVLAIVLPGLALLWAPLPRFVIYPWWVELFSLPIALTIGLFLTIALHELGHLAAARAAGFDLVFVMVGPLQWTRTAAGWKLLFSGYGGFITQGRVLALPPPELWYDRPALRQQILGLFSGGPLATLLQALLLFALLFLAPAGALDQVTRTMLIAVALLSTLFLAWTAYPLRMGEMLNDMAQIRRLLRGGPAAERLLALLVLNAQSVSGVRARELDEEALITANSRWDGSPEGLAVRLFAMAQAGDEGHLDRLAIYLDEILAAIRRLPPAKRPAPVLWEAASFEAQFGQDPARARGWLELAHRTRFPMFIEARIAQAAAETAVALAEGDLPAAACKAHHARKLLPFSYNIGGVRPTREWLTRIIAENRLEDPDPRPLRLNRMIWPPILFSVFLTTLMLLLLSFVIVLTTLF